MKTIHKTVDKEVVKVPCGRVFSTWDEFEKWLLEVQTEHGNCLTVSDVWHVNGICRVLLFSPYLPGARSAAPKLCNGEPLAARDKYAEMLALSIELGDRAYPPEDSVEKKMMWRVMNYQAEVLLNWEDRAT